MTVWPVALSVTSSRGLVVTLWITAGWTRTSTRGVAFTTSNATSAEDGANADVPPKLAVTVCAPTAW